MPESEYWAVPTSASLRRYGSTDRKIYDPCIRTNEVAYHMRPQLLGRFENALSVPLFGPEPPQPGRLSASLFAACCLVNLGIKSDL